MNIKEEYKKQHFSPSIQLLNISESELLEAFGS